MQPTCKKILPPIDNDLTKFSGHTGQVWKILRHGQTLYEGHEVISENKKYRLKLHYNGNLVFYEGARVKWESAKFLGKGPFRLDMQNDNNLVLYECKGKPLNECEKKPQDKIWSTDTCHGCKHKITGGKAYLLVADDGNFYLKKGGSNAWSSIRYYKDQLTGKMQTILY